MERAQQEVGAQRRQVYHDEKAEAAAGVGEPDGEDHETRRARRRRPPPLGRPAGAEADADSPGARQSKDPSQQSGNLLDLTG